MRLKKHAVTLTICGMLLLNGCGDPGSSDSEPEMIYVKSVSLYDTITDIYADPDTYLGKQYHMVGTLYPSTDDSGSNFYLLFNSRKFWRFNWVACSYMVHSFFYYIYYFYRLKYF